MDAAIGNYRDWASGIEDAVLDWARNGQPVGPTKVPQTVQCPVHHIFERVQIRLPSAARLRHPVEQQRGRRLRLLSLRLGDNSCLHAERHL